MQQQQQLQQQQQPRGIRAGANQRFAKVSGEGGDDDDKTSKAKKMRWGADSTGSTSSTAWMIAGIVIVFLVIGILIAVVVCKSKKSTPLPPIMLEQLPEQVPQYVGMQDPGIPVQRRAWNESASVFGPQYQQQATY